jgi:hypothetical protein
MKFHGNPFSCFSSFYMWTETGTYMSKILYYFLKIFIANTTKMTHKSHKNSNTRPYMKQILTSCEKIVILLLIDGKVFDRGIKV